MKLLTLLLVLLLMPPAYAATIHGTVYDSSLTEASNVKVTIDTTPTQTYIVKQGDYTFEVPKGTYTLRAEQYQYKDIIASVEENITVASEGDYRLDLILFPVFEDFGEEETEFIEGLTEEASATTSSLWPFFAIGLIIIAIFITIIFIKKPKNKKTSLPDDIVPVYEFIKKKKRTTQKEVREQFPLSEAKISLMISDLESRNLIRKIKKGRGNIIILN